MFDTLAAIISLVVGVATVVYGALVAKMIKNSRFRELLRSAFGLPSTPEKANFYEVLMKSLKNDLLNNIDDVLNMYSGTYSGAIEYDYDEKRYRLKRRLRKFLVFMLKQDNIEKEEMKKWKDVVTGFIKELETENPYADVPTAERKVLLEMDRLITQGEYNGIKGRMDDLAGMIQNRNEEQNRIVKINRWSVPLTIVGLFMTIIFGGLSIYLAFRPPKSATTLVTPIQTQQSIVQNNK